jgi:hypothetical protein
VIGMVALTVAVAAGAYAQRGGFGRALDGFFGRFSVAPNVPYDGRFASA